VEIERAVMTRVYGVSDPTGGDPEYIDGLRAAVSAALDYGFAGIERRAEHPPPIPAVLRAQARLAARNAISLDTVLRRCFAGYALLGDFLIQEVEDSELLKRPALQYVLRAQATLFDCLVEAVTEEHTGEAQRRSNSTEERRAEWVKRLLAGELLDTAALEYDFDAQHIAAIAAGPEAQEALRHLAETLDRRLMLVRDGEETVWAWLGGQRRIDPAETERAVRDGWPSRLSLAIGESVDGLAGWRLTHQQARAAWPIALRSPPGLTRYADVALLASMLQDELLASSVNELYLSPLSADRDGGTALRQTLRAYFAADRNVSSAAAALGVSRQTVINRLHTIEDRLHRPLNRCAAEIEAALRLEDLGHPLLPCAAFSSG